MSHLSPEQLSEWALGERSADTAAHLGECAVCSRKLAQSEVALGAFRESARGWSERQWIERAPERVKAHSSYRKSSFKFVLAALAVLLVSVVVFERKAPQETAGDAAFFSQIDQEVSRTVPAAMDPLSNLVAGDDGTGNGKAR